MSITIESKKLEKQLKKAIQRNPKATAKVVTDIALDLAGRSCRKAPVDMGDLRNNCTAKVNSTKTFENQRATGSAPKPSLKVSAEVGYDLPYAMRQHEELSYNHPKGGQAKYLEQPFLENEQKYIDKLKSIPDEVLK